MHNFIANTRYSVESLSQNHIWRNIFPFSLFIALTSAIAGDPEASSVHLQYHFRIGQKISMRVEHRAMTDTTIAGSAQLLETATDSTKIWTVTDVDSAGNATVLHSVENVTMTSHSTDRAEVRWSSHDGKQPPPGYEAVVASLGVPLSKLVIDPHGRILDRQQLVPSQPSNTGDLMVVPLPEEPVPIGHVWNVPQEVLVEVENGPRKVVRTRLRYELENINDGVATIRVDTTVLTPMDDPRIEARLIERIWDGTILFDIQRGCVLHRSTQMDRRVVGFNGPQSSLRYKARLEEQLNEPTRTAVKPPKP